MPAGVEPWEWSLSMCSLLRLIDKPLHHTSLCCASWWMRLCKWHQGRGHNVNRFRNVHHKTWSTEEAFTVLIHQRPAETLRIQLYRLSQPWQFVQEHVCPLENTGGGDFTHCRRMQKNWTKHNEPFSEANQLVPRAFYSKRLHTWHDSSRLSYPGQERINSNVKKNNNKQKQQTPTQRSTYKEKQGDQ